jgi:hypothetical protein
MSPHRLQDVETSGADKLLRVCRTMTLVKWAVTHVAPVFIVTSPVTSYADQIWSMSKKRSSAGFSLDIPLIMLVASILK